MLKNNQKYYTNNSCLLRVNDQTTNRHHPVVLCYYAETSSPSSTVFSEKIPANALAIELTALSKLLLPVKIVVKSLSVYDVHYMLT